MNSEKVMKDSIQIEDAPDVPTVSTSTSHVEEEAAPHLHSKTLLIVLVGAHIEAFTFFALSRH